MELLLFLIFIVPILLIFIRISLKNSSLKKQIQTLKKEKEELAFRLEIQEKMLFLQSPQAAVGELVGNISHQWKEPLGGLGAIMTNLQATLMIKGEVSSEKLNDSIEKSYNLIHHLIDTIEVFYRFFKSQKSNTSEFNLYEEIENIQKMVNYSMQIEHIVLKTECSKDIFLYGDRGELVNALLNILLNAKDILLERKIQKPCIELKVSKQEEYIKITIQDNAGGVKQKPIEKIFEYAVSSKENSTGIGLFIVKNIIEKRLQGRIKVENKDNGALFTLLFPATQSSIKKNETLLYEVEETAYEKIARLEKELAKQSELEKALRQWEDIFTQTHWGVSVHKGMSDHFETANPAFYKMYGYTANEIKTMTVNEFFAPESLEILPSKQKEAFEKSFVSFEAIHLRKDGSRFPVNVDITVIKNEYDEILYRIANIRDITEQKRIANALKKSEEAFRAMVENSPDVIMRYDKECRRTYINPLGLLLMGKHEDELLGKTPREFSPLPNLEEFEKAFDTVVTEAKELKIEGEFVVPNGERRWGEQRIVPELNQDGEVVSVLVIGRDITELRKANQNLLLKEFALNKINEAVFLIDENAKFQYVNESACKSLGYSEKELFGMGVPDIDSDVSLERFKQLWEEMKKVRIVSFDTFHTRKDDTIFPVEINSNYFEYQNKSYNLATVRDISERLEIEKRKEDEKMRLFFERQIIGMAITSPKEGWVQTNDKLCEMLGYTHEELSQISWVEMTHIEDREDELELFNKLLSGEVEDYTLEKRVIRKDKEMIYVNLAVSCVRHKDGSVDYILALIEDITERKKAIEALHISEERYRNSSNLLQSVMESSVEVTIFALDKEYKYLTFNEFHKNFYKNKYGVDIGLGKNFIELVPDKDFAKGAKNSWDRALSGESFSIVTEEETFKGGCPVIEYWNNYISPIFDDTKKIMGLTTFSINITKLREVENKLESLNATLEQKVKERTLELQQAFDFNKGIINAIPDLMFEVDKDGRYLNVWAKDEKLLAAQKEILLGNKISDILSPEATKIAMEAIQEADEKGLSFGKVLNIDLPDGTHWFELSSSKKADGNIIFISRDITERKLIEQNLLLKEFALNKISEPVYLVDENSFIHYVNEAACKSLGYSEDELLKMRIPEIDPNLSPHKWDSLWESFKEKKMIFIESHHKRKDGVIFPIEVNTNYIEYQNVAYSLTTVRDISERKKHERESLELEDRFSKIAVAAPGVNYIFEKTVDSVFRFTYLAPTFEELSGMSNEVVLNDFTQSFEMIVPQDRQRVMQSIVSSAENLTILHMEFRIMHPQKGILWVESQSKPEKLPDGTIVWYGFLYYITKRKNDEQNLGLLNKAIDNSNDAVYIVKDDNSIYYVSDGACRMLGYTKEEFLVMRIEDIDPLMSTEELSIVRDEVKKKQTLTLQTKHRKKNGDIIDVEITGTEFHYDDFSLRLAVVKDISERKKHEEEILILNKTLEHKVVEFQRAFELNEDIINTLPDLLFEMDSKGNYLNIWAQNKELLAQQKEILLGNNIYNVLSKEAADTILEAFSEADLKKVSIGKTIVIDLPDGKKEFELSVSKKSDGNYLILSREVLERF